MEWKEFSLQTRAFPSNCDTRSEVALPLTLLLLYQRARIPVLICFFQEGWELSLAGQDVGKWLPCHPSRLHSSSAQLLSSCRAGLAAPPISCAKGAARGPPSSAEEPAAAMVELFSACLLPWLARGTPRRRSRSRGGRGRGSICAQRRLQSQQI